jgi:hypothetical protein
MASEMNLHNKKWNETPKNPLKIQTTRRFQMKCKTWNFQVKGD